MIVTKSLEGGEAGKRQAGLPVDEACNISAPKDAAAPPWEEERYKVISGSGRVYGPHGAQRVGLTIEQYVVGVVVYGVHSNACFNFRS